MHSRTPWRSSSPRALSPRPSGRRPGARPTPPASPDLRWRSLGPAIAGGRVTAITVDPRDADVIYVGSASGGVFKTTNDAATWTPVFDHASNLSVGAIALAPSDPDEVWVGTGEANNRNSSPFGAGLYRSLDGGQSFELRGTRPDASDRPHRRGPEGPGRRLRGGARTPVRPQPGARAVPDPRRRQDVGEGPVHRRQHGRRRCRPQPGQSEYRLRRRLPASAAGVGLRRRRARERHLPERGRRGQLGEAHEGPPARREGSHRPGHLGRRPEPRPGARPGARAAGCSAPRTAEPRGQG